jgi:hypothetical protein
MTRTQLEHILRASAAITGADEFVVIGSQAILGSCEVPPPECLASVEADLFTFRSPDDANLIDGSIGEGSPFHQTFHYYAHGVGPETATLPAGWQNRLIPFRTPATGAATGLCLEVHDLAVSKLVAGRQKDLAYLAALLSHHIVNPDIIAARLEQTPISAEVRQLCQQRLRGLAAQARRPHSSS